MTTPTPAQPVSECATCGDVGLKIDAASKAPINEYCPDCTPAQPVSEEHVTIGYVGVSNGEPIFRNTTDEGGDAVAFDVYETAEDALARFFNVRRVRIVVDPEPIRHPEDWGAIDG